MPHLNIDKIKTGDIILFERDEHILHGKVTSIGCRYSINLVNSIDEPILFVKCFEHLDWDELVLVAKSVKKILIMPEVVHFT